MGGFFGDMDTEAIANLAAPAKGAFGLPVGLNTDLVISKAEVRTSPVREFDGKTVGGRTGLELTISNKAGKSILDWNNLPDPNTDLDRQQKDKEFLNDKLKALEIPVAKRNSIGAEELVGIELEAMIYNKTQANGYVKQTIRNIKRKGLPKLAEQTVSNVTVPNDDF